MADVTVTFYDKKNEKGDHRQFSGAQSVSDLKNQKYTNTNNNMKNNINSLVTGDDAYVVIYRCANYNLDVQNQNPKPPLYKVLPGKTVDNLGDIVAIHQDNMKNSTRSFELFDTCPNHFNLDQSDAKEISNCWVKLYSDKYYNGAIANDTSLNASDYGDGTTDYPHVCNSIFGAGSIKTTELLRWKKANSQYYPYIFYCKSLVTGSKTWLEIFTAPNFGGNSIKVYPNSYVPNINSTSQSLLSLRLYAEKPESWPDAPPPPVPGDPAPIISPSTRAQNQKYQTATQMTSIMTGIVGYTPVMGDLVTAVFGAYLNVFWPSNPAIKSVWNDIQNYTKALLGSIIYQLNTSLLYSLLDSYQGFLRNLYIYDLSADNQRHDAFNALEAKLILDKPYFLGDNPLTNPEQHITFQMAYTSLAIITAWIKAYHYNLVSETPLDQHNQKVSEELLTFEILNYKRLIQMSISESVEKRKGYLNKETIPNSHNSYQIVDSFNTFIYYEEGLSETDADNKLASLKETIGQDLYQKLQINMLPFKFYECLDPNLPNPEWSPQTYEVFLGFERGNSSKTCTLDNHKIASIKMTASSDRTKVAGLIITLDNGDEFTVGDNSGSFSVYQTIDSDEEITAFYGRSAGALNQFRIQTDKGLDLGLGGIGGNPFYNTPPQGAQNKLLKIKAYENNGNLCSLEFTYQIDMPDLTSNACDYLPYDPLRNS